MTHEEIESLAKRYRSWVSTCPEPGEESQFFGFSSVRRFNSCQRALAVLEKDFFMKAPAIIAALREGERLREALQDLVDLQNGPPLPKYKLDWERVMDHAGELLAAQEPSKEALDAK